MFLPGCDAILDSSIWGHARYVYVSNLCLLYLWVNRADVLTACFRDIQSQRSIRMEFVITPPAVGEAES